MTAKLIFISHGYSYNPEESYENAKRYAQFVARYHHIPISPVLLFHHVYDNGNQYEFIIENCKRLIDRCDEVWVFDRNGDSAGVREEMKYACVQKKPLKTGWVLCDVCHKKVGKINIQDMPASVLVSVVCDDCQASLNCNKEIVAE